MRIFMRLVMLIGKSWRIALAAVALGWATAVSWVALISTSAFLISYAALMPSIAFLQVAIVGVRFFGITRAVTRYLERLVSHTLTFRLLAELRVWLYHQIEALSQAESEKYQSGDLLSRISTDIEILQEFYVRTLGPPTVAMLTSLTVIGFFSRWSWRVAGLVLLFQVLVGMVLPLLFRSITSRQRFDLRRLQGEISVLVVDAAQGSPEIQVFGLADKMMDQYQHQADQLFSGEKREMQTEAVHDAVGMAGISLMVVMMLLIAIPLVSAAELDGRLLAVVVLGALASFETILQMPAAIRSLDDSLEAGRRVLEIGGQDHHQQTFKSEALISITELSVDKITFAYSQDAEQILKEISLDLSKGKRTALVGPSGSGKSSLVSILLGFRPWQGGRILLNGSELSPAQIEVVRPRVSVLLQDPFIFNASLAENIQIGKPDANFDQLAQAADFAGLSTFIASLPDGFETLAGQSGGLLSGGQRQRLALARALLKEADLYVFDEPFANLDVETSRRVLDGILTRTAGKSVLLISHFLLGMEKMDEILYLEDGRVLERGTHRELLAARSGYEQMYRYQQRGLDWQNG